MLKALPKTYRRQLVPVSDTADVIAREMPRSKEDLATALGNFIHRRFKVDIPASAWEETALPEHLKMRFAVAGPDGKTVAIGRDAALLRKAAPALSPENPPIEVRRRWEREGITTWDFGDLPESIAGDEDAAEVFFPALVRPGEGQTGVGLKLFNTHEEALKVHRDGVAALLEIMLAGDLRYLKRQLHLPPELARRVRFPGGAKVLEKHLYERVLNDHLRCNLRTAEAFDRHAAKVRKVLIRDGQQLIEAITPVLTTLDEVREILFGLEQTSGGQGPVADFLRCRKISWRFMTGSVSRTWRVTCGRWRFAPNGPSCSSTAIVPKPRKSRVSQRPCKASWKC